MAYSPRSHAFLGKSSPVQSMCLATLGLICAAPSPGPGPGPGPSPDEPTVIGGAGGLPFLFPVQPGIPGPEILEPPAEGPPSPEDIKRRAKTLAAALAASIEGGDDATRLAATLALLLAELDDSS